MTLQKRKVFAALLVLILAVAGCVGKPAQQSAPEAKPAEQQQAQPQQQKVVASTSWTALMAKAAGADNVVVLAPAELKHPPEYDFRPSDVAELKGAKLIIWGGYEPFMRKLLEITQTPDDRIIRVLTVNTPDNLKEQTRLLAAKLGTTEKQKSWEVEFERVVSAIKEAATKQNVPEKRVLVHKHLADFVKWLGYQVVGEFGPEELSPAKMTELAGLKPDLIIDNFHNPQGRGLADITKAPRVELRNFPGPEHKSLQELLLDNARKLELIMASR